jgi:hypothetical protein
LEIQFHNLAPIRCFPHCLCTARQHHYEHYNA